MGKDDEEAPESAEAKADRLGESPKQEANEDEAFRAALRHYTRRARLFKR